MTGYLVGGCGVLIGAVAALVYMLRYKSVKGKYDAQVKDFSLLKRAHEKLTADHDSAVKRLENENETLKGKNDEIRERVRVIRSTCSNPVDLNDALNRLFPVLKEGGEDPG
jgi:hypothetical protein